MFRKTIIISALLLTAAIAVAQTQEQCQGAPDECERQIRAMLAGRKFLGITMVETRWGPVIKSVVPNSPAARAGLRADDRIVGINSWECTHLTPRDVKRLLTPLPKNATLTFVVFRVGQIKRISAHFGILPKEQIDKIVEAHLRNGHSYSAEDARETTQSAERQH